MTTPSLREAAPDEAVAWQIHYTSRDGSRKTVLSGHNSVGDYRDIDPNAVSVPFYAALQPAPIGEPVPWISRAGRTLYYYEDQPAPVEPAKRPPNCGTTFCSCIECIDPKHARRMRGAKG